MSERTATITVFLRIIAIIIGFSLYQIWPMLTYAISFLAQLFEGPEFRQTLWATIGIGSIGILTWLLGLAACIGLLMLKSCSRWVLLGYFAVGLVSVHVSWVPYADFLYEVFDNPYMKTIGLELPNLVVVIITFVLFSKLGPSNPEQQPQYGD